MNTRRVRLVAAAIALALLAASATAQPGSITTQGKTGLGAWLEAWNPIRWLVTSDAPEPSHRQPQACPRPATTVKGGPMWDPNGTANPASSPGGDGED